MTIALQTITSILYSRPDKMMNINSNYSESGEYGEFVDKSTK